MKTNIASRRKLWALTAALMLTFQPLPAQVSELVATDDAGGAQATGAGDITSLDLYENGLYWTVFGGTCGGEFGVDPSLATLGVRTRSPFPIEHYLVLGCAQHRAVGGAVRDDTYAYYTTPDGVRRKLLTDGPNTPGRLTGLAWGDLNPGAMMVYNGRAYYSYHSPSGQISGGRGYFVIEYFDLPGAGGFLTPVTEVSHGGNVGNVGRIKKMGVIYRRFLGGGPDELAPYGLALTTGGHLLLFFVDQTIPQWRGASVIATGVTDFAVRREQFFDPDPFRPSFEEDQLYASVGTSLCPSDPPSRILTIDPVTHVTSTVWTSDGYISDIGLDQDYIFASVYTRQQLGGPFGGCVLSGAGEIRSKCSPASIFGACLDPDRDPNWRAIELSFAGANLRSDGEWLYFTRGKQVRRIRNNSPAARQDLVALGLEAVQVVQDMNNSVRLVEGKRTIVRAYAHVRESSSIQVAWFPTAQLRGFRNGVELPGPLVPSGNSRITRSGDLNVLRPDVNLSFQFELPPEWVRSGRLELRFTVNPGLAVSEYIGGADPLANNTAVAANISVVQVQPPCFVFASIHSTTAPNYWPWGDNAAQFASIMERAKSLLPVPDIHIHPTTERVSNEHVCIRTCDVLGVDVPCGFICNDPFDLSQSDEWKEALRELADYDSFDQNRPGCSRTHYVGAIDPTAKNLPWGGLGETPGTHFIAFMAQGGLSQENSPSAGRTIAHEFGHNLNRLHVNQNTSSRGCGGSTPEGLDPTYPGDTCTFAGTIGNPNLASLSTPMGFDTFTFKPVRPDSAADLMSYAPNRWPSIYTYNAMLNALGPTGPALAAAAAPPPGPYLLVRGILNLAQSTVRVKGCYSLVEGVADPAKIQSSLNAAAAQGGHGYLIRKLNAAGALLAETPLVLNELADADENTLVINQFITKPAGMAALQIVRGGVVLAQCRATPNAPVVNGVTALYNQPGSSLQIAIDATDADRDALLFSVQFSNNNGTTWRTLRVNEGSLSFIANARFLPGGTQCRVRVIASDGFNSALATSAPFTLPGRAPELFIGGVRPDQRLLHGTSEALLGFALDAEDGSLPTAGLSWTLAGPTPKTGTGPSLPLQGLSPGVYTATLSATDSHNNHGATTLRFEILSLVIGESSAPVVDGDASDAAYAGAATAELPLSPKTKVRFTHAAGNLYVAFTDLPYGGPNIRGRVGLCIDADGSGGAAVQTSDLVFYVDEDGLPAQYEGDGTQMQPRVNPPTTFKAVITRGQGGWNAEFRIADELIGGWNHAARIGVFDQSATTIFVLGIPIDTPVFAAWPVGMGLNNPATWAPAWLGSAPPAPANLPPVAKAEAPPYVDANGPTKVMLNGSASFDPEGASLSYVWTQLEGPSVTLENATTATPAFTADVTTPTTFKFRLVVNDGVFGSSPAEAQVVLAPVTAQRVPLPPTATRHEDGSVTLGLAWPGRAGDLVIIQASTDLVNWVDIATNSVGFLQVVLFNDARAGLYPQRFYRLARDPIQASSATGTTALQFDGVDDLVEIPHHDAFNSLPLTITAWIKTAQASGSFPGIVTTYDGDAARGYAIGLDQGRLSAWYFVDRVNYLWDGGASAVTAFVADGEWHHVAYVVDASGGRVYLDGALANTHPWVGTPGAATGTGPLRFGVYFGAAGKFYNGQLDDVTLWNSARTKEQILNQMNQPPSGREPGLICYWRFDEGSGTALGDTSSYGRNGALRNGTARIESTAPIYSAPPIWTALQFDGVDDFVSVPTAPDLNAFPLTVALWLKTRDTGYTARGLVSKYADGSAQGYSLSLSEGHVRAWYFRDGFNYVWDGGLGLDGGFVADGQWHHLALVVDSVSGRLYVDGLLSATLAWAGIAGATTTPEPLQLGRYFQHAVTLNGQLDEIALWNRALSEAEVNGLIPGRPSGFSAGLISYWSLDEGFGGTAADSSGRSHHGALQNGPTRIVSTAPIDPNPAAGAALRFDGEDDSVSVAHAAPLNAFPLTIAAWIKTDQNAPGYVAVANKYPAGSGNGYSLHIHDGRLYAFYFRGDGTSYIYAGDPGLDGGFIADGRWHHVAFVVDASGGRTYVDGVQTASLPWTGTPGGCTTTAPILFGLYPLGGQFLSLDGRMDEVTLWSRALDVTEVNTVMNFKQTGAESGLVGYWPFNHGTGTTATDATGHGYNGTLQAGPIWVNSDAPIYP